MRSASPDPLAFHATQRCHSVFSCLSPAGPLHCRLVASENDATRLPLDVERTSGSFPRLPISVTLFKLRLTCASQIFVKSIRPAGAPPHRLDVGHIATTRRPRPGTDS